jgi:hypothetical protein
MLRPEPCLATEIFISYRRSDSEGHARALHGYLEEWFDPELMFFDRESIESGDEFPARIREAVQRARVVLALIGPSWIDAKDQAGRRRLEQENDFVRQELALALQCRASDPSKRVIPVLFDETRVPAAELLPPDLATLVELLDCASLRGKNTEYFSGVIALVRLIERLGLRYRDGAPVARSASRSDATVPPEKLPLLCNRGDQDDDFRTFVAGLQAKPMRPLVCVMHGNADEAHAALAQRIEEQSLPDQLRDSPIAGRTKFVWFKRPLRNEPDPARFASMFRTQLASELRTGVFASDGEVLTHLGRSGIGCLIAVVSWSSSEISRDPAARLAQLRAYWSTFPEVPSGTLLGCIVCVKYERAAESRGLVLRARRLFGARTVPEHSALRTAIEASAKRPDEDDRETPPDPPRVEWIVLPELRSVVWSELDTWAQWAARQLSYRKFTDSKIRSVFPPSREPWPMDLVIEELHKLVVQA